MSYSAMELAEVFLKTGELDDALDALNQQLEQAPQDEEARRLRIQTNIRLNNFTIALDDLKQLNQLSIADYQTQSIIYQKMNNLDKAIHTIQHAHHLDPKNERLTERLIDLLLHTQQYQIALDLIRQQDKNWRWLEREGDVLALLGNDILAIARYGLVLAHLSELDGVMNDNYLQALKLRVILARAHAYRRLDYTDLARELYESAQKIIGEDTSIRFNLGLLSEIEGEHKQAVQDCQQALDNSPSLIKQSMLDSLTNNLKYDKLKQALKI